MTTVARVLQGFAVGITSDRSADLLAEEFARRGLSVVEGPSIETSGADPVELRRVTDALLASPPEAFVVVTAHGLDKWLALTRDWGLAGDVVGVLRQARVYARGRKAAAAAAAIGAPPLVAEPPERLSQVLAALVEDLRPGWRVGVAVDGSGSAPELSVLRSAGAEVTIVASYSWAAPSDRRPALRLAEGVIAGRVHAVIFTARPAVHIWFTIATEEGIDVPLRAALASGQVTIGCMGPVCAESVAAEGVDPGHLVVPARHRIADLAEVVCEQLAKRVIKTRRAGGAAGVELAGTIATIGGETYQLSPAEARLLGALVGSPDAVLSPGELLRSVWEGTAQDPQLVEMVVARLRRRLGAHGDVIAAVPRRGYSLRQ